MTGNTEVHGQNPNTQQAPLNAVQLRKLEQSVYAASLEYGKSKITTSEWAKGFLQFATRIMSFADLANRATSLSPELRSYLEAVESHMYRDRDFQNESITRGEFSSKESRESAGKWMQRAMSQLVTKVSFFERRRERILKTIETTYDISASQKQAAQSLLWSYPGESLTNLMYPKQLNTYLQVVFGDTMPLMKSSAKRLRSIAGTYFNQLSPEEKRELLAGEPSTELVQKLWGWLGILEKKRFIEEYGLSYSFDQLVDLDPTNFSRENLTKIAQEHIREQISIWAYSKSDTQHGQEVLATIVDEHFDWFSIAGETLTSDELIQLLENKSFSPALAKRMAEDIWNTHESWKGISAKETVESAQEKRRKYEQAERLNEASIHQIREKQLESGGSIEGEDVLLGDAFRTNQKSAVLIVTDPTTNKERYYRVSAGHEVTEDEPELMSIYITPIGEDGNIDASIVKKSSDRVEGMRWILPRIRGQQARIVSSEVFDANNGTSISKQTVDASSIIHDPDAVNRVPSSSTEDSQEEGAPDGASLGGALLATGMGWGGAGQPPEDGESIGDEEEEPEEHPQGIPAEMAGEAPENTQETQTLIHSLEELNKKLSESIEGFSKIEEGSLISIGKAGQDTWNVFKVESISETGLSLYDGNAGGVGVETISFQDLFNAHKRLRLKGLGKHSGASGLLSLMQNHSTKKDTWAGMEIRKNDAGEDEFDFTDRRFDSVKHRKHYFVGRDGRIVEILSLADGTITARIGEKYNEKENTASWGEEHEYPIQYLAHFMIRFSVEPKNSPYREIAQRPVEEHTEHGRVKHIFGRLSIHDVFAGGKKFFEEFKHKLEHGNHMQEHRVMLGIADKLWMKKWNAEWYWDYKSKAENEEKKMIEDRLDTLGKMSSPDRQKSIRASLLNDGTHDYDHWTNALSMIEKHGHLYAGGLQDLEGSWIYFRRIAGIPLDADISQYSEFQEAVKGVRGSILDGNVTEEAVIQEYMKKNVHFPNSQIWRMVKKRIQSGNDEELKNGGIEVEQFSTLDQRVNYALSKIESREYAHAIGAMEPIFDKDGPAHKKQSLAFMFAMSRIPERLPPSLLSKFTDIYNKGRLHSPALVFIKDLSSQAIFRDTVKAIVEEKVSRLQADPATQAEGNALKNDFDQMMGAISKNGDMKPIFASMKKFWESYGPEIQKELTAAPESSILSSSTARNENPALGRYHSKLKSQIGDANIANDGEIDRGTPFAAGETGASVIFLRPDKVIDKMGLNLSSNSFAQTGLEKAFQEDFVDALKLIRDKGVEELSEEDKRALFESVYTAFTAKIQSVSDISRFLRHETVKPFIEMGLEPPKEATRAQVEERTREIAERLAPKKKDLREKNRQIKQLSDANQQVPDGLELESVLLSQEVRQLEAEMKAEQNKLQRFGKYNPLDDAHQAHFEAMYARFTGSGTSVAQTVNHARNGAAAVMNPARQP